MRRAPTARRHDVVVDPTGPAWLADMLEPTVDLAPEPAPEPSPQPGRHRISMSDLLTGEPFVQATMSNPITRWLPPGAPEPFRSRAVDAIIADRGGPTTPDGHRAYRAAFDRTVDDAIDDVLRAAGIAVSDRAVDRVREADLTVVCVTARPQFLERVARNLRAQVHPAMRPIVITNSHDYDEVDVEEALAVVPNVEIIRAAPALSLGECLNLGVGRADSRFVAKFDDDDEYGPRYLSDSMLAHSFARAAVVGKGSYHLLFDDSDEFVIRFPGKEFRYCSHVAGATLVLDRDRVGDVEFRPVSMGEDQGFLSDVIGARQLVYSADRFSFVVHRHRGNSWSDTTFGAREFISAPEPPDLVLGR